MDDLARLLLRFLLVPAGYLAAVAAGAAVVLFGQWRLGALVQQPMDPDTAFVLFAAVVNASFLVMLLVSTMWLVAAPGILFAELFAVRSWMFHVANGAVSAWIGAQLFPVLSGEEAPLADPFYIVAAGLAGGLAYWAVAGWSAGFFKPVLGPAPERWPLPPPPPPPQTLPPA